MKKLYIIALTILIITGCEKKYPSPNYTVTYNISSTTIGWGGSLINGSGETIKHYYNQQGSVQDKIQINSGDILHFELYSLSRDSSAYISADVQYATTGVIRHLKLTGYHWKENRYVRDSIFLFQSVDID